MECSSREKMGAVVPFAFFDPATNGHLRRLRGLRSPLSDQQYVPS
jgi:hypothetical protein